MEEDVAAGEAESCQAVPCCRPRFDGAVSLEPPVFEVEVVAKYGDAQCAEGGAVAGDRVGVEWAGRDAVAEEFGVAALESEEERISRLVSFSFMLVASHQIWNVLRASAMSAVRRISVLSSAKREIFGG